jgi:hypothetical protein
MKQTAVEWLDEQITICFENYSGTTLYHKIGEKIEQAKEMEKKQIITAYNKAIPFKFGDTYYNETFGTPTPWYNEDQTTERMEVIGQNGNEGEHYNK